MAQINEAVLDEIRKYINDNPEGVSRDDLYAKCTTASNDLEIANCLRYLVGLLEIYKVGDIYKPVIVDNLKARHIDRIQTQAATEEKKQPENTEPAVTKPEVVDSVKTEVNETLPPDPAEADPAEADPAEDDQSIAIQTSRKYGTLARNAVSGQVGMYFYHYRNKKMTITDVIENLIVKESGNISAVIYQLVLKKYLSRFPGDTPQRKLYQWSGEFIYPFRKVKPEDISLFSLKAIQVDPTQEPLDTLADAGDNHLPASANVNDDLNTKETPAPQHSMGSESTHSDESYQPGEIALPYDVLLNTYMSTIDASIKHHESQIEYLKIMRDIAQRTHKAPSP